MADYQLDYFIAETRLQLSMRAREQRQWRGPIGVQLTGGPEIA